MYTYLIKSLKNGSYYTGITKNIRKRLECHNKGVLLTTKTKRPWRLVYWKIHPNSITARKHEKWLKKKNRIYKSNLEKKFGGVK